MAIPRKMIGLGTKLGYSVAGTSPFTDIGGLLSLPGPDGTADDIDTSTIVNSTATATYWKTFQRGQVDPGEMDVTICYGSTETASKALGTLYKTGAIVGWRVTFPSTLVGTETFSGYIKGMGRALEKDSMITRNFKIKVTGNPAFPTT